MIRLVIDYDEQTGQVAVQCAAAPAVANAILDLAKGAAVQATVEGIKKQAAAGIQRPTPGQIRDLVAHRVAPPG